jgi:hypothetical protein
MRPLWRHVTLPLLARRSRPAAIVRRGRHALPLLEALGLTETTGYRLTEARPRSAYGRRLLNRVPDWTAPESSAAARPYPEAGRPAAGESRAERRATIETPARPPVQDLPGHSVAMETTAAVAPAVPLVGRAVRAQQPSSSSAVPQVSLPTDQSNGPTTALSFADMASAWLQTVRRSQRGAPEGEPAAEAQRTTAPSGPPASAPGRDGAPVEVAGRPARAGRERNHPGPPAVAYDDTDNAPPLPPPSTDDLAMLALIPSQIMAIAEELAEVPDAALDAELPALALEPAAANEDATSVPGTTNDSSGAATGFRPATGAAPTGEQMVSLRLPAPSTTGPQSAKRPEGTRYAIVGATSVASPDSDAAVSDKVPGSANALERGTIPATVITAPPVRATALPRDSQDEVPAASTGEPPYSEALVEGNDNRAPFDGREEVRPRLQANGVPATEGDPETALMGEWERSQRQEVPRSGVVEAGPLSGFVEAGPLSGFAISPPGLGESQHLGTGRVPGANRHGDRPGMLSSSRPRSSPPSVGERPGEGASPQPMSGEGAFQPQGSGEGDHPLTAPTFAFPSPAQRELLTELVGIDPATVTIGQDQDAERAADSLSADAFAAGEEIVLPSRQAPDIPSSLGLLAHELTHVAQARRPRFVPPIVREPETSPDDAPGPPLKVSMPTRAAMDIGLGLPRPAETTVAAGTSGEAIALAVEARVTAVARNRSAPIVTSPAPDEPPAATAAGWNGLPAPWEPLPSWLATPMPTAGSPAPVPFAGTTDRQSVSNNGAGDAALAVQRAETGRQLPTEEPAAAPQEPLSARPEPDLDALARQVYAVLSRRLAAERRRLG